MLAKTHTAVAAALLAGSASVALAQTAPYDWTGDKTLSYGPRPSAAPVQPATRGPIGRDAYNPYDPTSDKTTSYEVRPTR